MTKQFIEQLIAAIEDSGGNILSVVFNYYDGESQKQAAFTALEIQCNGRPDQRAHLIEHRMG